MKFKGMFNRLFMFASIQIKYGTANMALSLQQEIDLITFVTFIII
jgi:hypothetical protein